jgi:hypothetical protein
VLRAAAVVPTTAIAIKARRLNVPVLSVPEPAMTISLTAPALPGSTPGDY